MANLKRQKRVEALEKRPVHLDGFVDEWPEEGLIATESPSDPKPSVKVVAGKIVEMDGKSEAEFDLIDQFIAKHAVVAKDAEKVMAMDSLKIAKMLVDPNVRREEIIPITTAMTPAKAAEVICQLNFAEMIMATQKMRPRKMPATQAHVTNI